MPLLVAPTAYQRLAHPDGEFGVARAAAAAGTVFCHSTLSSVRPAEVAAAVPDAICWFQLYLSKDRQFAKALLDEAAAGGYDAVVLTVDLPQAGRRERDIRSAFTIPPDLPLPCISFEFDRPVDPGTGLGAVTDKALTWRDLEWLRSVTHLPLVVKGILTAEDAELACDHGAAGVVVSNHGGRQLDGAGASLDALPEVVEAVAGRAEVFLDGGVRRGAGARGAGDAGRARRPLRARVARRGRGAARARAAARRDRARPLAAGLPGAGRGDARARRAGATLSAAAV